MAALYTQNLIENAMIADFSTQAVEMAAQVIPDACFASTLDELLLQNLDGIVIATPSALHAEQTTQCLRQGMPVFCQKPLGRSFKEVSEVIREAKQADRLLSVDFSYRYLASMRIIRDMILNGDIGDVYAANLIFHNAYGPDKPWYYNPGESGGGCLIDLGIHLVDLAFWTLNFPRVTHISSRLFSGGKAFCRDDSCVEDYAVAQIDLETAATLHLACSWNLSAGCDAVIEATFYGTRGGLSLKNVSGSFYDFTAEKFQKTTRYLLYDRYDDWGGKAITEWAVRLLNNRTYDVEIEQALPVVQTLDTIYEQAT